MRDRLAFPLAEAVLRAGKVSASRNATPPVRRTRGAHPPANARPCKPRPPRRLPHHPFYRDSPHGDEINRRLRDQARMGSEREARPPHLSATTRRRRPAFTFTTGSTFGWESDSAVRA